MSTFQPETAQVNGAGTPEPIIVAKNVEENLR